MGFGEALHEVESFPGPAKRNPGMKALFTIGGTVQPDTGLSNPLGTMLPASVIDKGLPAPERLILIVTQTPPAQSMARGG